LSRLSVILRPGGIQLPISGTALFLLSVGFLGASFQLGALRAPRKASLTFIVYFTLRTWNFPRFLSEVAQKGDLFGVFPFQR